MSLRRNLVCFSLDGTIDTGNGEACDDNDDTDPLDGCDGCIIGTDWKCDNTSPPSVCTKCGTGSGVKDPLEACDDGNNNDGDGCSSSCVIEPNGVCNALFNACTICGDSSPHPTLEGCDPPGVGCSASC